MIAPLLVVAVLLVPVAGLFAAADAALNSVSRAPVESLVREGKDLTVVTYGAVVPRASWPGTALREGASIDVVTAVQGG